MRILAIDLGKTKSVACIYETETCEARFQKIPTGAPAIRNLIAACRPDRVVIEMCPPAGWVGDLVLSVGLELQLANTSAPAWRWSNTRRKTDRDDALRLTARLHRRSLALEARRPFDEYETTEAA